MTLATFEFRPITRETLSLCRSIFDECDGDPVKTYGRLLSAAMVAGAMLGLTPEQITQQALECARQAERAVKGRPDIFGSDEPQ